MNRERLEHLIVVLDGVKARGADFDLGRWANDCGTICCAVGWAAYDPTFKRSGLKLEDGIIGKFPVYGEFSGRSAVEAFFDLEEWTAGELFLPDHYPAEDRHNPDAVIARIRELLDGETL